MGRDSGYEGDDPDDDDLFADEMFERRERSGRGRGTPRVSDFVRRAIENTVGSVQNTGSLSRDAIQYLFQQGDRGKREVVRIVAREVGDFLKHVDLASEISKVLTSVQVDVQASLRFRPSEHGLPRPEVSEDSEAQVSFVESSPPDGQTGTADITRDLEPSEDREADQEDPGAGKAPV